ncbi:hypothetical protein MAR_010459 [Mya arenaria]|uniref:EGF-like domain-containing protein n=1 Tax=Mya arenaria TaxID=6604 RepID=A0ABY7E5S8_MYAAR|nr:hypothetical protein MAR_010459 [Mya arenaria]
MGNAIRQRPLRAYSGAGVKMDSNTFMKKVDVVNGDDVCETCTNGSINTCSGDRVECLLDKENSIFRCSCPPEFAILVAGNCYGTNYSDPCPPDSSNADICTYANAQCINGTCGCVEGLDYDGTDGTNYSDPCPLDPSVNTCSYDNAKCINGTCGCEEGLQFEGDDGDDVCETCTNGSINTCSGDRVECLLDKENSIFRCSCPPEFAVLVAGNCYGTNYSDPCPPDFSNADICTYANAQCINGTCGCVEGLDYDGTDGTNYSDPCPLDPSVNTCSYDNAKCINGTCGCEEGLQFEGDDGDDVCETCTNGSINTCSGDRVECLLDKENSIFRCSCPPEFAVLVAGNCYGTNYSDPCPPDSSNADICTYANAQCINGTCGCVEGLDYDGTDGTNYSDPCPLDPSVNTCSYDNAKCINGTCGCEEGLQFEGDDGDDVCETCTNGSINTCSGDRVECLLDKENSIFRCSCPHEFAVLIAGNCYGTNYSDPCPPDSSNADICTYANAQCINGTCGCVEGLDYDGTDGTNYSDPCPLDPSVNTCSYDNAKCINGTCGCEEGLQFEGDDGDDVCETCTNGSINTCSGDRVECLLDKENSIFRCSCPPKFAVLVAGNCYGTNYSDPCPPDSSNADICTYANAQCINGTCGCVEGLDYDGTDGTNYSDPCPLDPSVNTCSYDNAKCINGTCGCEEGLQFEGDDGDDVCETCTNGSINTCSGDRVECLLDKENSIFRCSCPPEFAVLVAGNCYGTNYSDPCPPDSSNADICTYANAQCINGTCGCLEGLDYDGTDGTNYSDPCPLDPSVNTCSYDNAKCINGTCGCEEGLQFEGDDGDDVCETCTNGSINTCSGDRVECLLDKENSIFRCSCPPEFAVLVAGNCYGTNYSDPCPPDSSNADICTYANAQCINGTCGCVEGLDYDGTDGTNYSDPCPLDPSVNTCSYDNAKCINGTCGCEEGLQFEGDDGDDVCETCTNGSINTCSGDRVECLLDKENSIFHCSCPPEFAVLVAGNCYGTNYSDPCPPDSSNADICTYANAQCINGTCGCVEGLDYDGADGTNYSDPCPLDPSVNTCSYDNAKCINGTCGCEEGLQFEGDDGDDVCETCTNGSINTCSGDRVECLLDKENSIFRCSCPPEFAVLVAGNCYGTNYSDPCPPDSSNADICTYANAQCINGTCGCVEGLDYDGTDGTNYSDPCPLDPSVNTCSYDNAKCINGTCGCEEGLQFEGDDGDDVCETCTNGSINTCSGDRVECLLDKENSIFRCSCPPEFAVLVAGNCYGTNYSDPCPPDSSNADICTYANAQCINGTCGCVEGLDYDGTDGTNYSDPCPLDPSVNTCSYDNAKCINGTCGCEEGLQFEGDDGDDVCEICTNGSINTCSGDRVECLLDKENSIFRCSCPPEFAVLVAGNCYGTNYSDPCPPDSSNADICTYANAQCINGTCGCVEGLDYDGTDGTNYSDPCPLDPSVNTCSYDNAKCINGTCGCEEGLQFEGDDGDDVCETCTNGSINTCSGDRVECLLDKENSIFRCSCPPEFAVLVAGNCYGTNYSDPCPPGSSNADICTYANAQCINGTCGCVEGLDYDGTDGTNYSDPCPLDPSVNTCSYDNAKCINGTCGCEEGLQFEGDDGDDVCETCTNGSINTCSGDRVECLLDKENSIFRCSCPPEFAVLVAGNCYGTNYSDPCPPDSSNADICTYANAQCINGTCGCVEGLDYDGTDGNDLCDPCNNDTLNSCIGDRSECLLDSIDNKFRCSCPEDLPAIVYGNCYGTNYSDPCPLDPSVNTCSYDNAKCINGTCGCEEGLQFEGDDGDDVCETCTNGSINTCSGDRVECLLDKENSIFRCSCPPEFAILVAGNCYGTNYSDPCPPDSSNADICTYANAQCINGTCGCVEGLDYDGTDGNDLCDPCNNDTLNSCIGERSECLLDSIDNKFRCSCPEDLPAIVYGNCYGTNYSDPCPLDPSVNTCSYDNAKCINGTCGCEEGLQFEGDDGDDVCETCTNGSINTCSGDRVECLLDKENSIFRCSCPPEFAILVAGNCYGTNYSDPCPPDSSNADICTYANAQCINGTCGCVEGLDYDGTDGTNYSDPCPLDPSVNTCSYDNAKCINGTCGCEEGLQFEGDDGDDVCETCTNGSINTCSGDRMVTIYVILATMIL